MHDGEEPAGSVMLAESHLGLVEGIRGLLGSVFRRIFVVADEASLFEGAGKLQPDLIVAEVSLAAGDLPGFMRRLRDCAPAAKVLLLTTYDHPTVWGVVATSGADGMVLNRSIATDLLPAVDAVLAGRRYLSRVASRRQ